MLEAFLFDLDGTLADTDPVHYETWKDMLREYGLDIDPVFYKAHFSGRLNLQIIQDLLPSLSLDKAEALSDRKEAEFRRRMANLSPLPGLLDLLNWMGTHRLKRAIVTNAPPANAQFMLRSLKVEALFPVVVLGEELERGKPDPMPYQVALERLGVKGDRAVAFEDSPSGVRSAVGAGIPTVGIATTHDPELLYAIGATLVVPDFADPRLLDWLQIPALTS
ncbi:MAG TPA: HAD family phosphatase [Crinalium sp.]|jgi:HAD superfamily hydrolase (TIGR01509 family)